MNELHFGVSVGIDRYPGFPGRDLHSARSDAGQFAAWLLAPDGGMLPPANVVLVQASPEQIWRQAGDAKPQIAEVNRSLDGFHKAVRPIVEADPSAIERTRLYLYVSGHGIGPLEGECGLLMADADIDNLGNHIEVAKYRSWYEHYGPFGEVVIFADCCREIPETVLANGPPFTYRGTPPHMRAFTGYAAPLGERAWEAGSPPNPDEARGYFTKALLSGLSFAKSDEDYGVITSTTLGRYIALAVDELTRGTPALGQKAEIKGGAEPPIKFAAPLAAELRRVTLRFPVGFTGEVVVRDEAGLKEVAATTASAEPWVLELPQGLYAVEPAGGEPREDWRFRVMGWDVDLAL